MITAKHRFNPSARYCAGVVGILAATLFVTPVNAGDAGYDAAMKQAESNYEAAKEHCDSMTGNTKDVCIKQAQATRANAEANAKANHEYRATSKDAQQDKMSAQYKLEKEKCDNLSGDAQDACIDRAKETYQQ